MESPGILPFSSTDETTLEILSNQTRGSLLADGHIPALRMHDKTHDDSLSLYLHLF